MLERRYHFSLSELVDRLGGGVLGDGTVRVTQVASLLTAKQGQIAFLVSAKYLGQLGRTQASAVILSPEVANETTLPRIVHPNPYAYYARVATLLNPLPCLSGVHPSAVVQSPVPGSVYIGANAVIGSRVSFGAGVAIYPGCVIGDGVTIGDGSILYGNVVVYSACEIGKRAIIHSGTVIGSDGFGFAKDGQEWIKIPQIGRVLIGDDVEIGANTAIDRGALDDTVIGNGVKLDNQLHIAHNVTIGDHSALAACVGIAGSTHLGASCTVGGGALISGHINITDGVHVSGGTVVTKNLPKSGQFTGIYPLESHDAWLKNAPQVRHLDALQKRVRELEKLVAKMSLARSAGDTEADKNTELKND